jgi:penicillin amidase
MKLARAVAVWLTLLLTISAAQTTTATLAEKAKAALSTINGRLKVAGLHQSVHVLRDRWGVAHIYAQDQHDLFFAQGFVAAQDRLFQMELWKRSGQGRLAEVLGPSALLRDINSRLLRYSGDMKSEYESYSPDTKEILDAFTSGINAYIASRTEPGGQGLPISFQIAGFEPEPWKPEDCLNRMAAFSMTGNSFSELAHAQAVAMLGPQEGSALFNFDPPVLLDPAAGVDFSGLNPALLRNLVGSDTRIDFPPYTLEESNNWTISGSLTKTGKPLLANDPHRVIAEPSLRYMVHLVAPGWDVIGAGEPGLPGVALGHNQHIAWGFTIFGLDQQDLYIEELNSSDPLQYKTGHGWERMRVEKEVFGIRGGPEVMVDLKFTSHGPVLWEDGKRARALALRWVGAEPGTAGYLASLAVDRAQNWNEFEAAMARWKVPSENIVYADTEGNIGEHSTGLAPVRDWTGLLPVPGSSGNEWKGFIPNSQLPHFYNPKAGFIATANHRMIPEDYGYKVGYEWAPGLRFRRISNVLEQARNGGKKLALGDMEGLQTDVFSLAAEQFAALLRTIPEAKANPDAQLLVNWNHVIVRNSVAAVIYEIWLQEITAALIHRAAPEPLWKVLEWSPARVLKELLNPSREMFGDNPEGARNALVMQTLKSAHDKLTKLEGPNLTEWSWGHLHVVRFRHSLDQAPGAAALLDLGPLPRPGDDYTVNATYSEGSFEQAGGASYREILDPSNWDNSVAVNTPGQSGEPGSPHYSDLMHMWDEGNYFPLLYSREAVEKDATDRLELQP